MTSKVTDEQQRSDRHEEEAGGEIVVDLAGVDDGVGNLDQLDADLGPQADGELATLVSVTLMIDQLLPGFVRPTQQAEISRRVLRSSRRTPQPNPIVYLEVSTTKTNGSSPNPLPFSRRQSIPVDSIPTLPPAKTGP